MQGWQLQRGGVVEATGDTKISAPQLRETERQLDLTAQINRDLKDEVKSPVAFLRLTVMWKWQDHDLQNQKLQNDLVNKERHVLELQSEVDNLDKVISVKVSLHGLK